MARLTLIVAFAILAVAFLSAVDAQIFSYRVNVRLGDTSKFDKDVRGKLKISLKQGGATYKYALSPE